MRSKKQELKKFIGRKLMNKFLKTFSVAIMAMTGTMAAADEYPSKTIEVVTHAGNGG